jgi:hypothetical protein
MEDVTELPFNMNSIAESALSNDDKTLYFASDAGNFGQSDLFKVTVNGDVLIQFQKI